MPEEEREIKLIINMKGTRAVIGVQSPDSDPVMEKVEGTRVAMFKAAGVLVDKAVEQWKTSPKNPKSDIPAPPAPAPSAPKSTLAAPTKAAGKPVPPKDEKDKMKSMF